MVPTMGTLTRRLRGKRAESDITRLMGACAMGFVVGPLNAYSSRVGAHADAVTFFLSSILFTAGGLTQCWLAFPERRDHRAGRLAWQAAWIQSVGTLLFNLMTFEAISRSASAPRYDALVWVPNAIGSACFLVSGALLYLSAPRDGWRPLQRAHGWWEPPVNLLGCVLFGISALAGFSVPSSGQLLAPLTSNWTTTFGAACFLAIGVTPLLLGMTFKVPRRSRLVAFERTVRRDLADAETVLRTDATEGVHAAERETTHLVHDVERGGERELSRIEARRRAEPPPSPPPSRDQS